jgi:hypothetical protein
MWTDTSVPLFPLPEKFIDNSSSLNNPPLKEFLFHGTLLTCLLQEPESLACEKIAAGLFLFFQEMILAEDRPSAMTASYTLTNRRHKKGAFNDGTGNALQVFSMRDKVL